MSCAICGGLHWASECMQPPVYASDSTTNPCNDCKVEFRSCPLYPAACKRLDEYAKAVYTKDTREIVCDNGCWYLMEVGTWRIMASGPLPVPEWVQNMEAK